MERRCADVTVVTWGFVPVLRSRQFRCEIDSDNDQSKQHLRILPFELSLEYINRLREIPAVAITQSVCGSWHCSGSFSSPTTEQAETVCRPPVKTMYSMLTAKQVMSLVTYRSITTSQHENSTPTNGGELHSKY